MKEMNDENKEEKYDEEKGKKAEAIQEHINKEMLLDKSRILGVTITDCIVKHEIPFDVAFETLYEALIIMECYLRDCQGFKTDKIEALKKIAKQNTTTTQIAFEQQRLKMNDNREDEEDDDDEGAAV
jgi:antitoxin component of RelBE/YafQ-DinJ toxin-antitoxin module